MTRTPDVMDLLAAARPARLDPAGTDDERRYRDLERALSQRVEGRSKRRSTPRRLGLGLGLVAAGGAAAVAIATVGQSTPGSPGSPGNSPRQQRLSGQAILLAAEKAELQPMGKYWFSDQVQTQSYLVSAKTGNYAIAGAATETFAWTAAKTGGGSLFSGRELPTRPLTKADEVAWRKAGSPKNFRIWSVDHYAPNYTKAGKWEADVPQAGKGGRFAFPGIPYGATVEQLEKLPTDSAVLAKILFSSPEVAKVGAPKGSKVIKRHLRLSNPATKVLQIAGLLENTPVPPKVRAGIIRALAAQPGVRSTDTVIDPLGRTGVALVGDWPASSPGFSDQGFSAREELVFSKETGEVFAQQEVLVKPGGIYRTAKPGFVINSWALRGSGWTNTKPTPPAKLPW
jgi:hypothetical protein